MTKYQNNLEFIDTQEKAYILGLFYSDGCTSYSNKNNIHSRISLHYKDDYLLIKLKEIFPFFKFYSAPKKGKKLNSILYSGSRKLNKDLIFNGCLPSKSINNKNILEFPKNIQTDLIKHFIRGVFDGDGGCTLTLKPKSKIQKRVYIYSNGYLFITQLKNLLEQQGIQTTLMKTTYIKGGKENYIYKIQVRTSSYNDFYNFLYENSIINLNRKKNLFEEILKHPIFIKEKIEGCCPNCKSEKIVKNGIDKYYNKQRYLCRNCNKTFLQTAPLSSNI